MLYNFAADTICVALSGPDLTAGRPGESHGRRRARGLPPPTATLQLFIYVLSCRLCSFTRKPEHAGLNRIFYNRIQRHSRSSISVSEKPVRNYIVHYYT